MASFRPRGGYRAPYLLPVWTCTEVVNHQHTWADTRQVCLTVSRCLLGNDRTEVPQAHLRRVLGLEEANFAQSQRRMTGTRMGKGLFLWQVQSASLGVAQVGLHPLAHAGGPWGRFLSTAPPYCLLGLLYEAVSSAHPKGAWAFFSFSLAGRMRKLHILQAAGSGKNMQLYLLKKKKKAEDTFACAFGLWRFICPSFWTLEEREEYRGHAFKKIHCIFFKSCFRMGAKWRGFLIPPLPRQAHSLSHHPHLPPRTVHL